VVLSDPFGERLVERRLPASSADCPAMAGAMAAVVERSLRTLGWTRGDPLPLSARKPETVAPPPVPARQPRVRPRPPRLVLDAGPWLGTSQRTGTNVLFEARVCAVGPLCVRLGGALLSSSVSQGVPSGTARMTSRYFTLAPLAVLAARAVEWAGGLILLVSYDHGNGDLAQTGSGDRATLAVGVATALAVRLSPRWRLGVGLEGFRAALGGDFFVEIDGKRSVVLAPPPWESIAALRLEFLAWP